MTKHTCFFESPLSADVTITDNDKIIVQGAITNWKYGISPEEEDMVGFADVKISDTKITLE